MSPSRADRFQTYLWLGLAAAFLALLWLLTPILTPFVVAGILAYLCDPAVGWLAARRLPRPAAVLMVILVLLLALLLFLVILLPTIYREAVMLLERVPDLVELINSRLSPWLREHFNIRLTLDSQTLRQWITANWSSAQDLLPELLARAKVGGLALLGWTANLILIPVVMFYLLQDWPRLLAFVESIVPRPLLPRVRELAGQVDQVLSQFLRGQLSVMLALALYYSVGLWLAGLDFALPVGLITGLLVFIPYVGFSLGLVLAVLTALLQAGGWGPLTGVAVVYGIGQLVESFALTPYLVGERIGLHPLAVIFALMAFGQLFGFTGILLALPASAALLVGLRELRRIYLASRFYRGSGEAQP
ncbi:MAG: AI-2E family transporter [Rhodocyclaceae bacterium]|jgi:predicted PurR-regulated permease PerM|nr:AI-2E family transporter [Rhodocyclaceae bacterium]